MDEILDVILNVMDRRDLTKEEKELAISAIICAYKIYTEAKYGLQ